MTNLFALDLDFASEEAEILHLQTKTQMSVFSFHCFLTLVAAFLFAVAVTQ